MKGTVNANLAVGVDVGVEEAGAELQLWGHVGVLLREVKGQSKDTSFPDGVEGTVDDCLPEEEVVIVWHCVDPVVLRFLELLEVLQQFALGCGRHPTIIATPALFTSYPLLLSYPFLVYLSLFSVEKLPHQGL